MKKLFITILFTVVLTACGKNNNTSDLGGLSQFPVNVQGIMTGTSQVVIGQLKTMFQQKAINTGVAAAYSVDAEEGSWNTTSYLSGFFTLSNLSNLKYNDYIVRTVSSTSIGYDKVTNVSSGSPTYASGTYTETDKQNFISKVFPDLNFSTAQLIQLTGRQAFIGNQTVIVYRIVMKKLVGNIMADVTYEVSPDLPLMANPLKASENYNGGIYRNVKMIGQNYVN
jgi:hypothetical protein